MLVANSHRIRRGTALYLTVLSTALIVSTLGLAGLTLVRFELRKISANNDRRIARMNADSAVQLALRVIANDANWRTTYTNGVETTPQSAGSDPTSTLSWILEDSDGSLTDADTELRLKGVGRVGDTVQVSSVELNVLEDVVNCLELAVCAGGDASFSSNSVVSTDQTLHSNGSVSLSSGGIVNSAVEAVGTISGSGTYNGTTVSPASPRSFPNASVFDYYISNGTPIAFTSLPKGGPARELVDVVLSPNSNPYGPTNPEGIYIIDCGGELFRAQFVRVIGTLVLINPDPVSDIEDSLSMEPAVANYPALLVQGSVDFKLSTIPLSEASRGVNYNPPGSPYEEVTDFDFSDSYPSQIKGLVYVSGRARFNANDSVIEGVLVSGDTLDVALGETLSVTYDPIYYSNPPPGFTTATEVLVKPGSWLWDAAP